MTEPIHTEIEMTEAAVGEYLRAHPEFFDRNPDVLAEIRLPHPHAGRAISLQERQLEVMRERHRTLERHIAEIVQLGQENDAIGSRLQKWTRDLLLVEDLAELPGSIIDSLATSFSVPQVAMRLWGVLPAFRSLDVAQPVEAGVIDLARMIDRPRCGANAGVAVSQWLPEQGESARSVAELPLRRAPGADVFGLIVLGSPDPDRFHAAMGTDFLERIAETASAALSRLIE